MPAKYLERLFFTDRQGRSIFQASRNRRNITSAVSTKVRMVDSETQTDDELLEALLMEKLQEAYERR